MNSPDETRGHSLVDFGPLAREYDRWYATLDGMKHDATQKADVLRILGRPGGPSRLLDVGCGTGHWSCFFASLGYIVTGMDLSTNMLEIACKAHGRSVACCAGNASRLPFEDASFDVAAAMATLEFLADPTGALREMARCVRTRGHILIGTLNRAAALNRRRLTEGTQPYASGHLLSPDALREMLQPFGPVRMAASDPDRVFGPERHDRSRRDPLDTSAEGPFIVAVVQR